jgi:ketol-acid reductoisomerase
LTAGWLNADSQPMTEPLKAFYDADADLELIKGRRVAIIGYGSQGKTQALNLRDSGVGDIVIGLREGPSVQVAQDSGFEVVSVAEAAGRAEVLALLTSDEAHRDLYRDEIAPRLQPGSTLVFAHGLSVRFGLVEPKPDLDVVLVSPKGIGPRIRELYLRGEGVFGLVGVHQDASGGALATALSFGAALGCGRKGMLLTTLKDECESDLFAEQVVLCGGTMELVHKGFQTLVDAGYPPEVAWFETFYELKLVVDLMVDLGIAGAFGKISNTAEYGAYETGERVIGQPSVEAMNSVLAGVQDGSFVKRLMADYDAGFPELLQRRAKLAEHPIEAAGRTLRDISLKA